MTPSTPLRVPSAGFHLHLPYGEIYCSNRQSQPSADFTLCLCRLLLWPAVGAVPPSSAKKNTQLVRLHLDRQDCGTLPHFVSKERLVERVGIPAIKMLSLSWNGRRAPESQGEELQPAKRLLPLVCRGPPPFMFLFLFPSLHSPPPHHFTPPHTDLFHPIPSPLHLPSIRPPPSFFALQRFFTPCPLLCLHILLCSCGLL
eukprot:RCo015677